MAGRFTDNETWKGAFYELALELGPRSDERLHSALRAIWQPPYLTGCYTDRNRQPQDQDKVEPGIVNLKTQGHLLGIAILPDKQKIPCGTVAIREQEGPDWLVFYVPLGPLEQIYMEVGGFFGTDHPKSRCWREPLENWLAEIGSGVFSTVRFSLGLIGCEVSGLTYASEVNQAGVPEERGIGYLWPAGERVEYFPTNKW